MRTPVRNHRGWLIGVAAAAALAGAPRSHAGPTTGTPYASFEPSLARLPSGRMILAYDDESGAFNVDPSGRRTAKPQPSWIGVATSDDGGATWSRRSPIPTNDACTDAACVRALVGDPHVVSDPLNEQTTYFVGLASTTSAAAEPAVADALAVSLTHDGETWAPPRVFLSVDGGALDKISVAASQRTLAAAYVSAATDTVSITNADGIGEGKVPVAMYDQPLELAPPIRSPIFRLQNALFGYMAFLRPRDAMGALADVVVVRVDRVKYIVVPGVEDPQPTLDVWHARDVIFHRDSVAIDPLVPGALGRKWRDAYPISFEMGNFGHHLYIAYRELAPDYNRSIVVLYECDDDPVGACMTLEDAHGLFDGWTRHEFDDCSVHGSQYQPTIATSLVHDATLSWYERVSADPTDLRIALKGARSSNDGKQWSNPVDLRGGARWTPCPSARGPLYAPHDYGDRFAAWIGTDDSLRPVTAFVDSTTCEDRGEATFDQHVEIVRW